ncbi:uncharacterized protein LOC112678549 isoform X2 [Canis lupus dingo]|uniref:uncharacterized protein LOC112678549 isoform X2 n=1 Tax=Canis lupus dingo TaxID=286419 RepID=UPI0020C5838E|nr:uncharacterized protein LOC112678549 isoform X2 [Canis lupus dingo]
MKDLSDCAPYLIVRIISRAGWIPKQCGTCQSASDTASLEILGSTSYFGPVTGCGVSTWLVLFSFQSWYQMAVPQRAVALVASKSLQLSLIFHQMNREEEWCLEAAGGSRKNVHLSS